MTFMKREALGNLLSTNWYQYAVQRTGITMPNCFTYATARISEIVGYNQPLDISKVRGAGDLWEGHAAEFTKQTTAQPGALMIWKGGNNNLGHVAVCEDVIGSNTNAWSQSNYGGAMFEYIKGNPNRYWGMQFMGYLYHKDLQKSKYKIGYEVHMKDIGWGGKVYDGMIAGTVGQARRVEALRFDPMGNTISAKAHLQTIGWQDYGIIRSDTIIGTVGQSLRMEALCLNCLNAAMQYRVHIAEAGWSAWTRADGITTLGSVGLAKAIEAIQIQMM